MPRSNRQCEKCGRATIGPQGAILIVANYPPIRAVRFKTLTTLGHEQARPLPNYNHSKALAKKIQEFCTNPPIIEDRHISKFTKEKIMKKIEAL